MQHFSKHLEIQLPQSISKEVLAVLLQFLRTDIRNRFHRHLSQKRHPFKIQDPVLSTRIRQLEELCQIQDAMGDPHPAVWHNFPKGANRQDPRHDCNDSDNNRTG